MSRRHQRNAFTDKCRDHVNDEFIDLAFIEERSDQTAASHHPDVFAFFATKTLHKFLNRLTGEFESGKDFLRRPPPREDIVFRLAPSLRNAFAPPYELHRQVIGPSAH